MQYNNIHGRVLLCTLISSCQLTVPFLLFIECSYITDISSFAFRGMCSFKNFSNVERFEIQVGLYGIGGFHIKEDLLLNKWTESIALCYDVSKK